MRILEADDDHRFVRRGYPAGDERIRSIDDRDTLEIDVRLSELRTDVIHIVRHPAQDRVSHGFGGIAARTPIAMEFLDPFEIDDRHDADLEIGMLGDVDIFRNDRTMQSLVE